MARKSDMEHRIMGIQEGKDKKDLTVITYQTFVHGIPQGEPWKAYKNYEDYEVLKIRWILLREFRVPEHLIDKFETAVRDAKERDDVENDVYSQERW